MDARVHHAISGYKGRPVSASRVSSACSSPGPATTMSLSRALTTCRLRLSSDLADRGQISRSSSARKPDARRKISAPIQLIHTTNMLSYNAPDLPRPSRSNSTATRSDDDSDAPTTASTPPTSPDVSPDEPPLPNHLTYYFTQPAKPRAAAGAPPEIPRRSPSHTKNSFDKLARARSDSRQSTDSEVSKTFSRSASTSTRASSVSDASSPSTPKHAGPRPPAASPAAAPLRPANDGHPFGQELAKVYELAEQYSAGQPMATIDEEQQYLDMRGLQKLTADDYLGAVQGLSSAFFSEPRHATAAVSLWI